jgi:hypothetical protein
MDSQLTGSSTSNDEGGDNSTNDPNVVRSTTPNGANLSEVFPSVTSPTAQPTVSGIGDNRPGSPETSTPNSPLGGGKRKRRWILPAAIAGVLAVLLAGGYAFAFYLPNRPSHIYSTSLTRSGLAVDELVNYTSGVANKKYKSVTFSGKLQAKSSGMSMDATVDGSADVDANATLAVNADIMGQKMGLNVRSIHASANNSPDVYVQLSGIKSTLDNYGLSEFDTLDGQWIAIDHTIMDSAYSGIGADTAQLATKQPTATQIEDAVQKAQQVNKQYIFTTDKSTAVLKQSKYVGKESKDNRSVYHYKVGYDKAHLQAYIDALGKALDSSKLNDWSKAAGGKDLSQTINIDNMKSSVKDAKADYVFDMWVDTKTKLIHSLQFASTSGDPATFTIAQNYTGGDDYPFQLTTTSKVGGQTTDSRMKFNINKKTDKVNGEISIKEGSDFSGTLTFDISPSDKSLDVQAPSGAKPLMDVLNQFGLGGTLSGLEAGNSAAAIEGLSSL